MRLAGCGEVQGEGERVLIGCEGEDGDRKQSSE